MPAQHDHTSSAARRPWNPLWVYAILMALAASSVYTAVRSLGWPMFRDAPIMQFIAREILSGRAPYKDLFDMNMPGTYLVHMFIIKVLGPGVVAWHVFNVACALVTAALIIAFCAPYGRLAAAAASLMFACHYFGGNQTHVGQRDFFLGPLLMAAAYGWARYLESGNRSRYLFLCAVTIGMAVTIKPIAALFLAFIAVSHVVKTRRRASRFLGGVAVMLGGVLIAPAGVMAWLASTGSVASMWQIMTQYLPLYAHLGGATKMPMLFGLGSRFLIFVPLAPFAKLLAATRAGDPYRRYSVLMAGVGYGILHFIVQGKGWYYHLYPINLFLLTLAGMTLGDVMREPVRRTRTLAVVALAVFALPLVGRCVWEGHASQTLAENAPVASHLVQHLEQYDFAPTDKVQVLDGTKGGIHALYLLGLHQPTRFVYDMYFYHDIDTPLVQGLRRELIEQLSKAPPRLIVQVDYTWVQSRGFDKLASFPELAAFLAEHYRADVSEQGFTIYVAR